MFKRPSDELSQFLLITRPPAKFWMRRRFALVRAARGKKKKSYITALAHTSDGRELDPHKNSRRGA